LSVSFDGGLEEFLQIVYDSYKRGLKPSSITIDKENSLFEGYKVDIDDEEVSKVLSGIKKLPQNIQKNILNAFFSEENIYTELFLYIREAFKKESCINNINLDFVSKVEKSAKRYRSELHKLKGFLRFEETKSGLLYAKIETKHFILPSLGSFFKNRMPREKFIIYDTKRKKAFLSEDMSTRVVIELEEPELSEDENIYKKAWSSFFDAISIRERENKKLQTNKVPLYLREYMCEFHKP